LLFILFCVVFFLLILPLNFIPQYLFSLDFCFFIFSCLLLMESPWSHDLSYKYERLTRVNFDLFLNIFFSNIVFGNTFFALLFMGPSQFYVLDYILICSLRLARFTQGLYIYICVCVCVFPSYQQVFISYIFLMCSVFLIFFYGWVYSVIFVCIYHLSMSFLR
jgi:hypothetical protein